MKHGKETIDILVNKETGVSLVFQPSPKMKDFRRVATVMAHSGKFFHRHWLNATKVNPEVYEFRFEPVSRREWNAWCDIPGFKEWFYSLMPDIHELDEYDMKFMEAEYWEQIRKGMLEGQSWAIKEFSARRFSKSESLQSDAAVEMSEWIASGHSAAWGSDRAEA